MSANRRCLAFALASILLPLALDAQRVKKGKDGEPLTEQLPVLPDPPLALTVETRKLTYVALPLTAKGLFSQQVRDQLKSLIQSTRGAQVVKIRAFVAGGGDLRRVSSLVSEVFAEKKLTLPVISTIQAGALPMDGAQVQLEAVLQQRQPVHEHGLAFFSGQQVTGEPGQLKMGPLVEQSIARLKTAFGAAAIPPGEALRVACFVTSLEDAAAVRSLVVASFPRAAALVVQTQRAPAASLAECEAIAPLHAAPSQPVQFLNPEGLPSSPNYSQIALAGSPRLVLAGAQLAFRYTDADAQLAFRRLERTLQANGTSLKHAVMTNVYPLSSQLADVVRKIRFEFLDSRRPPASTMLPFEGLPGLDAAFSLEVVAAPAADSGNP